MPLLQRAKQIYRREGGVEFAYRVVSFAKRKLAIVFYLSSALVTAIVGRRDDIWIFGNFAGDQQFSENSKYLYLEAATEYNSTVRPIWITKSEEVHEALTAKGFEVYYRHSLRAKYFTLRAGLIFLSSSLRAVPLGYTGGATTVQLTHGIPLKRPRQRSENSVSRSPVARLYSPVSEWVEHTLYSVDYFCTSSEYCTDQYRYYASLSNHTGYLERSIRSGNPLSTGFPKTDIFYRDIESSDIGITPAEAAVADRLATEQTVIGYFPTFRGYDDEIEPFDPARLDEFLDTHDVQLAIKPHRHMEVGYDGTTTDNVVMISPGMDSYPILDKIDILVTDYSSIYFDFLHLDRPVVFYTFDHDEFTYHRGPMTNYEQLLAGPRVNDFDSLLETLEMILETDDYATERAQIRDEMYDYQDGGACDRIYSQLLEIDEE